jgi:hypothetical protein
MVPHRCLASALVRARQRHLRAWPARQRLARQCRPSPEPGAPRRPPGGGPVPVRRSRPAALPS